ncbi:MAG: hypothetical protein Q8L15_00935 [Methylobacter sp.]|nr:hypothetical protein [Methylobacter sp.]
MAIRHTAYGFDAEQLAATVSTVAYKDAAFDAAALHRHAQEVFKSLRFDHPAHTGAFAGLRIDEERLFSTAIDEPEPHIDFLTLLCEHLVPAPNLSQRIPMGYFVLQTALPSLGWSKSDIRAIVFGDPLAVLLAETLPHAVDAFPGFPEECGWLSAEHCAGIVPSILDLIKMLDNPTGLITSAFDALAGYAAERQSTPHALLKGALFDALEMLEWSQTNQSDLFLLLEY